MTREIRDGEGLQLDDAIGEGMALCMIRDGELLVWRGGHTINVWVGYGKYSWRNSHVFSIGDFSKDSATPDEVEAGMRRFFEERA